jgi:5-methylcytosine-specific restriction endonuclease McrA
MPIRPENKARYPKDWAAISIEVREAAGNKCEGSPDFPDCRAANRMPHPETGSMVVLTVAHLDHTPENIDRTNLKAMCQRCHLNYDKEHHAKTAYATRRAAALTNDLFPEVV